MARIFDYKFVIILGLSLIVYFLYREVEHLNKRVTGLENNMNIEKIENDIIEEIQLPLSPTQDVKNVLVKNVLVKNDLVKNVLVNNVLVNNDNTVEEYSNEIHQTSSPVSSASEEINIYSHDILNTNTNDIDSVGIESIINMAQENNINTNDIIDQIISVKNSPKEDELVSLESKENNLENLMKLKLTELQYMATNMDISITVGDSKKKKTKSELANEIFNKK